LRPETSPSVWTSDRAAQKKHGRAALHSGHQLLINELSTKSSEQPTQGVSEEPHGYTTILRRDASDSRPPKRPVSACWRQANQHRRINAETSSLQKWLHLSANARSSLGGTSPTKNHAVVTVQETRSASCFVAPCFYYTKTNQPGLNTQEYCPIDTFQALRVSAWRRTRSASCSSL